MSQATIHGSTREAATTLKHEWNGAATSFVAHTKLAGGAPVSGGGVLKCVGTFDAPIACP